MDVQLNTNATFALGNIAAQTKQNSVGLVLHNPALVAGAWTERIKMFLGGSFLKLADDNKYIKNPEAQNPEVRGF